MMRVGILADDLTGACDTAVQFVRQGWQTEVQVRPRHTHAEVIAVSSGSRALPRSDAATAVHRAVEQLRNSGITRLYKKIDSTLRGQLSAELEAALKSWSPTAFAVVCPAFPAAGRLVIDGVLTVDGVPVAETAARHDPVTPVTESHIPTLLRASRVSYEIGESLENFAARLRGAGPIAIVDAISDEDLTRIAAAVAVAGDDAVPVGSAGLARHLAARWGGDRKDVPVIVVVTSSSPIARRQIDALRSAGARVWTPLPAELLSDDRWHDASLNVIAETASVALVVLSTPEDGNGKVPSTLIPARFAEFVARVRAHREIGGIVVTGGDGASAVFSALEAHAIDVQGEIVDGVPMGTIVGGPAEGTRIVTKAGGFGDEQTLVRAAEAIRNWGIPRP